ncbi:Putative cyclase [Clostridium cavendishii DSM 21758]|uniref:Putative cyclase n=1 Tax=Clostridium cavendishii DSM 21758 TaxID=1121302 RepID=A0A1M6LHU3_9CLOT|nr:cyclase family protein [Clostridium cavendishii]SHJ70754.1 Putative cyclase [Clostridium cavendishii DSM 21758]
MIIDLTTKCKMELIEPWLRRQENKHIAMGHVGTHLDTYLKSQIPLEYFKRRGVLVNTTAFSEKREINKNDIDLENIKKGDFVIFRTDRIKKVYGTKEYFENHPQLSHELIKELCHRKVSFIGIDTAGIRQGEEHTPADKLCEDNNIYVIENLSNLDKITSKDFLVYTMWIDDKEATGLKCKVICEELI